MDPIYPQPSVPVASANFDSSPKKRSKVKIMIVIILPIFLFLILGVATAIAYEKIKLNNPAIERPITQFILNLPFTPKTPKFLLQSAALAHAKISRHSFNISLAAKSDSFTSSLGLSQIDAEAKGSVDYSDPNNLKTYLNGSITKDFNFDIRKDDSLVFVKINKFPALLSTLFKVDQQKLMDVLQNWIGIDTKPLDTEARRTLDQKSPQKSLTKEYLTNLIDDLLDEKLLPALSFTKEQMDSYPSYKVHLTTDDKTIDNLVYKIQTRLDGNKTKDVKVNFDTTKPSDYIKELVMDLWIDQKDYYVRKVVTSFKLNPNYSKSLPSQTLGVSTSVLAAQSPSLYSLGSSQSSIATVIKFDDFGKSFTIDKPSKYLKPEEFFAKVLEASDYYKGASTSAQLFNPSELSKRSRDAARLTDLANLQQAINVAVQESNLSGVSILCKTSRLYPCSGNSITDGRVSNGSGWMKVDLNSQKSISMPTLPVDPTNDVNYHYIYCANSDAWEINTVLESDQQKPKMANDGGDDDTKYEVGSSLNLIDKVKGCKY